MSESILLQRWHNVKQQIDNACKAATHEASFESTTHSKQKTVTLLAVSKKKSAEMIVTLAKAGQRHFGENYLQEATAKMQRVSELLATKDEPPDADASIVWHYIGHIQRNKTRDIAENFDWVHTIERDIIAKRLHNQRPEGMDKLNVLIQVNIDEEDSKSGCQPIEVDELIQTVKKYDRLNLRGLMIIPSKQSDDAFERTKILFDEIANTYPELSAWDTLSMGMSADMDQAIHHGSTMVRVGSAIFGARD